ncbi:major facilitator superfamily domain-containing protein [Mariannaea sp. PMI_226]|nr:major facilitator superfamily domain-containing protein [Mariannaea sp. PMI_226]
MDPKSSTELSQHDQSVIHLDRTNVEHGGKPKEAVEEPDFSHIDEAKALRKMDVRLLPVLAILYLLSFLDRGNIGNANIQGLSADLGLSGNQYNICLTAFFFTYSFFEIPSNLILKKMRPSIYLPAIMIVWGSCTATNVLLGLVRNYHSLLAVRICLGIAEAGLYPGCAYYLTMWYCASELQFRQGLFYSGASLAGAFSGLLAYAIVKMDGIGGYEGWRWIFIIEGLLTVVGAFVAFFVMFDFPETASFLTDDEKAWAVYRLKYQGSLRSGRRIAENSRFQWKNVIQAVTDWQLYLSLFVYWGIVCPLYGIALFLPTIINQLGYTASRAQLLTIPIYVTASILTVVVCYFSDRAPRSTYVIIPMCAILAGFVIAIAASAHGGAPGAVYAGVFIATCGIYPAFPGNVTWIANNLAGSYKRAAGMAFQIGVGNLGGAMASNFYRKPDGPKYILGHALEIGFITLGLIALVVLRLRYAKINAERDRMADEGSDLTDEQIADMGDRAPTFRYVL